MPGFFIEKLNIVNDSIILEGEEARHIGRVMRFHVQDRITLFDKEGTIYTGLIIKKDRWQILVKILKKTLSTRKNDRRIILGQALPKAKKMDLIVQKSTELGISEILPFFSSRSIPQLDREKAAERLRHWQSIIIAAAKQSGIYKIPTLESIVLFHDLIKRKFTNYLKIVLWEDEPRLTLKEVLTAGAPLQNIIYLIGPEGGFSKEEIDVAHAHGFLSVKLGDVVLRTETAGIAVLAIICYEMGILG